jgi:hypothetical protein
MVTLSGCFIQSPMVKPPESLMTKVPNTLPPLTDGTGRDVVLTMREWGSQYHECRIRQHGLIDAINEAY